MTTTLAMFAAILLHEVHETVSEIEWNAKQQQLEVALRLSVLDEEWIRRQSADQEKVAVWAVKYLERHFRIDPEQSDKDTKKKPAARYRWVGRQQQGSHVWWYFEIEPYKRLRPSVISVRMLFDRDDTYVNRVVVLEQKTRRAVTLTTSKPTAKLDFAKAVSRDPS